MQQVSVENAVNECWCSISLNKIKLTFNLLFAKGSSVNDNLATILVGLVQLISNISSLFVVDKFGRKPLLIMSAVVMSISMFGMGSAFYLQQHNIRNYG